MNLTDQIINLLNSPPVSGDSWVQAQHLRASLTDLIEKHDKDNEPDRDLEQELENADSVIAGHVETIGELEDKVAELETELRAYEGAENGKVAG